MKRSVPLVAIVVSLTVGTTACSGGDGGGATARPATTAAAAIAGIRTLAPAAVEQYLASRPENLTVLDVRTPQEYGDGHLAGARDLDIAASGFQDELAALDRTTPYVVYCHSGNRSAKAVALMRQLGFHDVTELQGGMAAWTAAGLPVVTA